MGVLARTVDIGVPQSNVRKTILAVVEIEIVLTGSFTHAVGTDGTSRVVFVGGKGFLFAVNRPPRRRENELFNLRLLRTFKDVEHAENIHARVIEGIGNRTADVHLGR